MVRFPKLVWSQRQFQFLREIKSELKYYSWKSENTVFYGQTVSQWAQIFHQTWRTLKWQWFHEIYSPEWANFMLEECEISLKICDLTKFAGSVSAMSAIYKLLPDLNLKISQCWIKPFNPFAEKWNALSLKNGTL